MDYDDYTDAIETWETEQDYILWPFIIMNVVQGVATVVGLLANALLLVLFAVTRSRRTVSGTLLLQRAIADVLALVLFPFVIYQRSKLPVYFHFDLAMCTSLNIIFHVGVVASTVLLMAYTLESYQAAYPQYYTLLYRRKTLGLTSGAAWALAVATGVAAYFFSYDIDQERCIYGPLFSGSSTLPYYIAMQVFLLFVIPLVVVWVFVSMALPPRHLQALAEPKEVGEGGPNRRLLLGLASSFTVLQGLYWVVLVLDQFLPLYKAIVLTPLAYSLSNFGEAVNAILVIRLSEELRQQLARWLPSRHSDSVPLQDL